MGRTPSAIAVSKWSQRLGFVVLLCIPNLLLAAPRLATAVSRMSHGPGKNFDVSLPLTSTPGSGIECRDLTGGDTIVLTYSEPITQGTVTVLSGRGSIIKPPAFHGKQIEFVLGNLANGQKLKLSISGVSGVSGDAPDANVEIRYLLGDVNSDGAVNGADQLLVQSASGKVLTGANFRTDVNRNGVINALDATRIRAMSGTVVPGGRTLNTPPKIARADGSPRQAQRPVEVPANGYATVPLSLRDLDSASSALSVTATSDDPTVLSDTSLSVSGDGDQRTLTIISRNGAGGRAPVRVTVSDGLVSNVVLIPIVLDASSTLFVAQMLPPGGVSSGGSGVSSLKLSPDNTTATLTFSYSNLTTAKTSAHLHGPARAGMVGDVLYDFDANTPNLDGQYVWTITDTGTHTAAEIVNAIKTGQTYVDVHSTRYPADGEIRGQYLLVNGSSAFIPPPPVPPAPSGPLSDADAARFLVQATYGPTEQDIAQLKALGIDAWLEQQFNTPPTSHLSRLNARFASGDNTTDDGLFTETWWNVALTGKDQLRQRVAYALSQIFVISQVDGDISGHPNTAASYYDMLAADAFKNYRKLLEDVTLHPAMGQYLDMRASRKANTTTGTIPNENYPREILQLFSIGLYKLHPDGSLQLNVDGNPIDTYDQNAISGIIMLDANGQIYYTQHGLASAFTGWNWHQAGTSSNPSANYLDPMTSVPNDHELAAKTIFDGIVIPAGQSGPKDMADCLNAILNHPNTGPFICKQLIQRLVCSNPSPGYVYRVSQVFADNGQGVRGDLRAVIKAIYTDYEARSPDVLSNQGFGKLKEPVLRTTQLMRALHVRSTSGLYRMRDTDDELSQTPMRASTVFNFYEPTYAAPGAITSAGLASPEFQIFSETSVMNTANFFWNGIRNANAGGTFKDGDLALDLSTEQALASNPANLVDRLNKILMAGQMSATMRQRIIDYVNTISASDTLGRARAAVQLVVTSPEYATQR
jgi:uncharacterized protein (DUF1800 family)